MPRDIVRLRRVGDTLVVTMTQVVVLSLGLKQGDRLLLESVPPRRVIITKEVESMGNSTRVELEIQVLEAKRTALGKEFSYVLADNNLSGAWDVDILEAEHSRVEKQAANLHVQIAEKQLELFELQESSLFITVVNPQSAHIVPLYF